MPLGKLLLATERQLAEALSWHELRAARGVCVLEGTGWMAMGAGALVDKLYRTAVVKAAMDMGRGPEFSGRDAGSMDAGNISGVAVCACHRVAASMLGGRTTCPRSVMASELWGGFSAEGRLAWKDVERGHASAMAGDILLTLGQTAAAVERAALVVDGMTCPNGWLVAEPDCASACGLFSLVSRVRPRAFGLLRPRFAALG